MELADRIRLEALLTPAYRRELNDWSLDFCIDLKFKLRRFEPTERQVNKLREIFSETRTRLRLKGGIK